MRKNKGITLIALVITIVVLIILASVAITLSLGDNGIFKKASKAKEDTQVAQNEESMQIAEATNSIDDYVSNTRAEGQNLEKVTLKEGYTLYRNGNKRRLEFTSALFEVGKPVTLPNTTDYPSNIQASCVFCPYNTIPVFAVVNPDGKIITTYGNSATITAITSGGIYGNITWYVE